MKHTQVKKESDNMVQISKELYQDVIRCFNTIPNTKVAGLKNGKNTYQIVSLLEKAE